MLKVYIAICVSLDTSGPKKCISHGCLEEMNVQNEHIHILYVYICIYTYICKCSCYIYVVWWGFIKYMYTLCPASQRMTAYKWNIQEFQ